MKPKQFALASLLLALTAGCSRQAELDDAKRRIATLEAELVLEKLKASMPAPVVSNAQLSQLNPKAAEQEPHTTEQWVYRAEENKMSGGTSYYASLNSSNTVSFHSPYDGAQHGRLTVRTDPLQGRDIFFSIKKGQILCQFSSNCEILVRFDDGKPEKFSGTGPSDNSTDMVFILNYDRFLGKLRKAKTMRLSTNIYQEGSPMFEFDVSGFDHEKYFPKK